MMITFSILNLKHFLRRMKKMK